jgi:hypothetical protein
MRLKTKAKRSPHARLRRRCEPKRNAHLAKLICKANKQAAIDGALEKRGRRRRKNEARDVAIKARAAARAVKPIKPEFAA